jgi:hypothetical protein
MKITLAIPTNADWERLNRTKQSLVQNTAEPENVDVIFVDNRNTFGHDMQPFVDSVQEEYRGSVKLVCMPLRCGLTTAWKWCTDSSSTDWTVITNDDIYFMPGWDTKFRDLLKKEPGFGLYLLCHPYNWSGFAVHTSFVEEFPWRTEFPAGYHEDNDIYLRVATARGLTTKSEIYTKAIYCLPFATSPPQYCFQHLHHTETQKSKFYTRWNEEANLKVFTKYWRQCAKWTPGAIENKNGHYYTAV